jgi:MraZ protein
MFRGAAKVTLDDKGRMVLPTRFRDSIINEARGKLLVTLGLEKCLLIYPQPAWEQVERTLMDLPSLIPQSQLLQRLILGYATELELDSHFRFLLPSELRSVAKLERQVMLVGQGNRIELWDEGRWNEQLGRWSGGELALTNLPPELRNVKLL